MKSVSIKPVLFFISITLIANAGCFLLLYLSQFSQEGNPFTQLPLAVVILFGALFTGLIYPLGKLLKEQGANLWLVAAISLAVNALVALVLNRITLSSPAGSIDAIGGAWWYIIAPFTAMSLAHFYTHVFKRHAGLLTAMTVYIVCTLLANFTFDSFLPLPQIGLISVGTLFFGITFTQRDRVHQYGRRQAYLMIFIAAIANVALALALETPLRFVAVSFAAIVISEVADTEVYQRFIKQSWITRVAASNAVSIPLDTIIFTVFAFYGQPWATVSWMLEVIATDIIVKLLVGFLAAIRLVGNRSKLSPAISTS